MKTKLILICLLMTANCGLMTGTVRYVSKTGSATPPYTTWATASDSIQKCINLCQSGDTVYVANGVYKEKIGMIKGLALIGSGMDSCIIDTRELATPTDFFAITFKDSCRLIGFQVIVSNETYGTAVLAPDVLDNNSTIVHNHIRNASTGMYLFNTNCSVAENILTKTNQSIRIEGFTSNYFPIIDNNIILYPRSYGIVNIIGCKPTITNNIIYLNIQYSQGLDGIRRTPLTANNIVIAEVNGAGGYFFTLGGNIRNNFLIGHTLIYPSNAFALWQGSYYVRNNLIMNTNYGVKTHNSTVDYKYNNVWNVADPYIGFTPDSTNLSLDPMIVNEDSGDVHLQMFSPMIDAGDPQILDVDGSRSDIGAYGGPLGRLYKYIDLPPRPPRGLIPKKDSSLITIKWKKNTEADFNLYRVYRDTTEGFIIDSTKLIAEIIDTIFQQYISNQQNNLYYKITAVDNQANESAGSEEIVILISDVNEPILTVEDYCLYPNYPNPFNPSTIIGYRIKEVSYVKLIVYDIKGEIIRILVNEVKEGGYYEEELNAEKLSSGIYIYRLYIRNGNNIPVYSSSGKMLYLK